VEDYNLHAMSICRIFLCVCYIMSQQNNAQDITQIINNESARMSIQKQAVDAELETQKKVIQYNESYRRRFQVYTEIVVYVIIGLCIYLALIFMAQMLPFIPAFVFDIATAITFVVIAILSYKKWGIIAERSKLNFDELDLAPMPAPATQTDIATATEKAVEAGDLLALAKIKGSCVGEECCDGIYTKWDSNTGKCVNKNEACGIV